MELKAKILKKVFSLGFALLIFGSLAAQNDTTRILFVGNSFTYYYNLSQVVTAMAKTQGLVLETRQSTVGGSNLKEHWNSERGTKTRMMLANNKWDYVVFNHHSLATFDTADIFKEYSKKFTDLARENGAVPVFMETWAYKANPLMINTISESYKALSDELKVDILPCGQLFSEARKWRPDLEMFSDHKHPSYNGTYLLGLAFFKYFTGKSTANIPKRLSTLDINGENLYLIFMDQDDADFLQQLVDEFDFTTRK
jgi:hypothetical protein